MARAKRNLRQMSLNPVDSPARTEPYRERGCPIVGVGASAGGFEAFTQLLERLDPRLGMALVLIQHLNPTHASQLTQLLSAKSPIPVHEVRGETEVRANHVYVIPAGKNLTISGGILHTVERNSVSLYNMPIDDFFEALATDQGGAALGVVLSGTASDGTRGLKTLKAAGGITFAQEPDSAKFDSMPRNAISSGGVDFVLRPEDIAKQLKTLRQHSYLRTAGTGDQDFPQEDADLGGIFVVLRSVTGIDFTGYKRSTILRRVRRRMALHGMEDLTGYIGLLNEEPTEVKSLANDFLISVTAFFREPEVYETLRERVFPALIEGRRDPIRIWVPGCASGEEAYSLAIALTEFLQERQIQPGIQIFATDLNEMVIQKARSGLYPESALGGLSPERIKRFFVKTAGVYQVIQTIRDLCIFAKQDVVRDPPFSKVDVVSCCSLLIYLGPEAQNRAISLFHYALRPAGFLILGSSESVGTLSELFEAMDLKQQIHVRRKGGATTPPINFPERAFGLPGSGTQDVPHENSGPAMYIQNEIDAMLLAEYAPPGVIVDDALRVLEVRGKTGPYLHLAQGAPSSDLARLVRPGLLAGLNKAMRKARRQDAPVRETDLQIEENSGYRTVNLRVSPIRNTNGKERRYLVLFEDADSVKDRTARAKAGKRSESAARPLKRDQQKIQRLEQELEATREHLESIIESQETVAEELRSAMEEAQASNEELDTAREALQASNEELNTLNEELRARNADMGRTNTELRSLLDHIDVPLVLVGKDLSIRGYTHAIEPLLKLKPADKGRVITDLRPMVPNFREMLMDAIKGEKDKQLEFVGTNGRWFSLRTAPCFGPQNSAEGAIASLVDIDDMKRARDFAEAVVAAVHEPLLVLDGDLKVRTANDSFYRKFRLEKEETEGCLIYEIGTGQWNIPALRLLLEQLLQSKSFHDFELEHRFDRIGQRSMLLNAREIAAHGEERTILLVIDDVTELRRTNEDLKQFIFAASHDLQEPLRMVVAYTQLLAREFAGKLDGNAPMYINHIVTGGLRMEALVSGLREFWQVSEQGEVQRTLVDCNRVLGTVLLNLDAAIRENSAQIAVEDLPVLTFSEIPMIQLFQNLIGNAIKYHSAEAPRIQVSAFRKDAEWIFSVADNGIGIEPRHADQVFRVFKRLHPADEYPGTGIGLAICHKIVERYKGRIWVEPNNGQGSIFKFTVPV